MTTPAVHVSDGEKENPTLSPVTFIILTAFADLKTMDKKKEKDKEMSSPEIN